jgi:hypothetical protein
MSGRERPAGDLLARIRGEENIRSSKNGEYLRMGPNESDFSDVR